MKRKGFASICLCGLSLTLLAAPLQGSATGFDQMIQQKNNEIEQLRTQRQTIQERITHLTSEIDTINKEAQVLLQEQNLLYQDIDQLEEDIAQLQVRIDKRAANIEEQARETQVNGKSDQLMDVVLAADSISDFVGRLHAMTTIVRANNQMITQQKIDQEDLANKQKESKGKVAALHATQSRLEAQKGEIEGKQADLNVEVSTLAYQESVKEDENQQLKVEKEAFEAEQARIQEEAARAAVLQAQAEAQQAEQADHLAVAQEVAADEGSGAASEAVSVIPEETPEASTPSLPVETPPVAAPVEEEISTPETPALEEQVVQRPAAPTPSPTPAPAPASNGAAIVAEAYKHLGKPYVWGGKGPDSFDCSGFTRYVYLQVTGRDIGGWTVPQEAAGTVISVSQAQAGDLLFWGSAGSTHHVAIALGNGQYIHAPRPGKTISVGSNSNWAPSFAVRVN